MKQRALRKHGWMARTNLGCLLVAIFLFGTCGTLRGGIAVQLWPQLRTGEVLQYKCSARIKRSTRTESRVAVVKQPDETETEIAVHVRAVVREVRVENGKPVIAMHAELESLADGSDANGDKGKNGKLDFTIGPDGQVLNLDGFEDLPPEQRIAWQFWISQFAYAWTLPAKGASRGEKWKSSEVEETPTPIRGLVWERETTYVRDDKCPVAPTETCAVLLTRATLKQKSAPANTTPDGYRLRQLKTSGFARGTNETITYISLKSHLLMRGKEELQQMMDATVAKADGSNDVRYSIKNTSQLEVQWVGVGDSGAIEPTK